MLRPLSWKYRQPVLCEMTIGGCQLAVYSFKDNFKYFSACFTTRGILSHVYILRRCTYSCILSKVERVETAKRIGSRGGQSPRPVWTALLSGDTVWDNVMIQRGKESLSSGSERTGWTLTVAEWRFLLWSLFVSVFFSALSVSEANKGESSSGVMRATQFLLIIQ